MERRLVCPGNVAGNGKNITKKCCGSVKRGGSLDIPRGIRPVGQVVESPSSVHKMFSEPQVRITSKMDDYDQCQSGNESVSSDTFQFEALPPVIKSVKKDLQNSGLL